MKKLFAPLTAEKVAALCVGDTVLFSGTLYTARDAAHKKIVEHFEATGEMLLQGQILYYAGPCPAKAGEVIGSIGPTTSYRMDAYTPILNAHGVLYSIGKGERCSAVKESIHRVHGVHFDAIGGAGAYYTHCVTAATPVYFAELGAEAVYRLEVVDFPMIVAIL